MKLAELAEFNYGPYTGGDGRFKIGPTKPLTMGVYPMWVTYSQARAIIDRYRQNGHSTHSAQGATLWVLLEWLHYHRLPYRLTVLPNECYYLEHFDAQQ